MAKQTCSRKLFLISTNQFAVDHSGLDDAIGVRAVAVILLRVNLPHDLRGFTLLSSLAEALPDGATGLCCPNQFTDYPRINIVFQI